MQEETLYTDSSLLGFLAKGEQWAFETLYRRYWRTLFNSAYKRLKDLQQSEDVIQNVFMRLWNNRSQLDIKFLPAYLNVAVRYEVLKLVSQSKTKQYFHNLLDEIVIEPGSSDQKILCEELADLVYAYAQTLPRKRRNILMLHLQKNSSTKEIAGLLNISQKTVQNQLRTALNGLYERIFL